jgi:hypothetical protein
LRVLFMTGYAEESSVRIVAFLAPGMEMISSLSPWTLASRIEQILQEPGTATPTPDVPVDSNHSNERHDARQLSGAASGPH